MVNMLKKYINFGLRNDKNLSDVNDPKVSLDNILNDLANPGETFDSDDFLEAIRSTTNSISTIGIRQSDVQVLRGITQEKIDANNNLILIEPFVTLKDLIYNFKVISGDPSFVAGGDGIKAKLIPSDDISDTISAETTGDSLFNNNSENIRGPFYYWDLGNFAIDGKIDPSFSDFFGMIQWEGYYVSGINREGFTDDNVEDINRFTVFTNGLFVAEYSFDDFNWTTISSLYAYERTISFSSDTTTSTNQLFLGDNIIYVSLQDVITDINSTSNLNVSIESININAQTVTLSENINVQAGTNEIVLNYNPEEEITRLDMNFPRVEIGQRIKLRMTVWWKDVSVNAKQINFSHLYESEDVSYSYFYDDYDRDFIPNEYSAEYFYKNHVNKINKKTNSDFFINESTNILYDPPLSSSDKFIASGLISFSHENFYTLSDLTFINTEESIEFGDYIVIDDASASYILQISELVNDSSFFVKSDNFIFLPKVQNATAYVLKNSGFLGCFFKDQFNNITKISDEFGLNSFITENLISDFSSSSPFFRINKKDDVTGFSIIDFDDFQETGNNLITEGLVYVYSHRGITDRSGDEFCDGVFGKELEQEASVGDINIVLTDITNVAQNQYVQMGNRIPAGTRVEDIDEDNKIISLSNEIAQTIELGITITFSPTSENREFCIIPLNTAPPFVGTSEGLKTTSVNPKLKTNDIAFEQLELKDIVTEEKDTNVTNYTKTLTFSSGNDQYSFFIL